LDLYFPRFVSSLIAGNYFLVGLLFPKAHPEEITSLAKKEDDHSFITLSEFEDLQKPKRFVPRTLVDSTAADPGGSAPVELITHVRDQLRKLVAAEKNWFGCSCVEVIKGDGMSWNCEAINQFVAKEFSHLKRWRLTNNSTLDSLPLVANYIKLKSFLRLAIANDLTDSFFSFISIRSWMMPIIFFLSLAVSFLSQLFDSYREFQVGLVANASGVFTNPKFYVVNVILLGLGVASQYLATLMSTRTESGSVEKLVARLNNIEPSNLSYDRFIDQLARKLQTADFPRVVIIDNFEALDTTTRHVIARYFKAHSSLRSGSEYWIIFENGNGSDRLSNLKFKDSGPAYAKTKLFRQLLLTPQEKVNLVKLLSKSQEIAEYDVVSRICHAEDPQSPEVAKFFKSYRDRHPKKETGYDDLDFLFLLSLTADNVFLTHKFLLKNLPEKTGLRPEVLSLYLGGSKLRIEEFRNLLAGIQDKFSDFLIIEPDGELTKIKTVHEKTDVLIEMADDLGLDAGLGHLFWAFFWHDKQPQPVQGTWLRKLSRHLLQAEAVGIADTSSYIKVRMRLFEGVLFCIDNCLKACLFSDITALISKGAALLKETELAHDDVYERRQARLLKRCWAAYSLLGDEEILRVMVELYETPGKTVNYHRESSLLEKMFFESIGLSPEKRKRINPELLEKIYGRAEEDKPIADYVRARSSWLALAGGRLVDSDVCRFISALRESDLMLPQIAESASSRIQAWVKLKQMELRKETESKAAPVPTDEEVPESKDELNLTDLMSLSLSLWCSALRFNPRFSLKRFHVASSSPDDLLAIPLNSQLSTRDFSELIDIAESAALLANEVKRPNGDERSEFAGGSDYLMSGLAKELCALSLASVLIAERYLAEIGRELTEKQITDLDSIIQLNNKTLEYSLPEVRSVEDFYSSVLAKKVESLMKLCGIMWRHFGTERLADFMNIRRALFGSLCLSETEVNVSTHHTLLQSVGPVMNRNDFAGVVANLTIAEAVSKTSGALAANYAIRAADFALNGDFGKSIQDQLVLNAVESAHIYNYPLDAFIKHIIAASPGQESLLDRLLPALHPDDIAGSVLSLLNLASRASNREDARHIIESLKNFGETTSEEGIRTEVKSQLEFHSLRQTIAKGEAIDADELMANWSHRKDVWIYASVLRLLLDNNYDQQRVKEESLAILERTPVDVPYNSYLLLSLSLAQNLGNSGSQNGELATPMSYLIRSHPRWEQRLSPALNLEVFKTLYQWDPENQDMYQSELQKWMLIDIEEQHLKRLPRLINLGHFFFIFRYYFDSLSFWGLETEIPSIELASLLSVAPEQRRNKALAWKNNGAVIPQPLLSQAYGTVVNSQFLATGNLIFDPPCSEDAELHDNRIAFNQAAMAAIDQLFELMIQLPALPSAIRDLLRNYAQMLSSQSLPPE